MSNPPSPPPDEPLGASEPSPKEIFVAALAQPPERRAAFLDRACRNHPHICSRVEALLRAYDGADSFLNEGRAASAAAAPGDSTHRAGDSMVEATPDPLVGTRIGAYKLLEHIGEGGFGAVYMAEQRAPVHRKVALKLIKPGMDSRQVIARFEAERQALALMDHPHIAQVFDGGVTDAAIGARPYFVMEYVRGDPVTAFADAHKLNVRERLDLFTQVCQAVQHAHTKGIIHRDLKPRNVMVSMVDGKPFAKVIDFGIAKATGSPLTDKTLFTEHRQLLGTPEYMSPEQAEGSPDIDTRTDVYALGVLLYELLTGATPFDAKRLRSAAFAEMQRIIKEEEPPLPSVRLARDLATLAAAAAVRRSEPGRLGMLIKGELDWIVMRALDKDRTRRYETANGLAADIGRHLHDEPVQAGPPSAKYKLQKFIKRNRTQVIAGGVVAAALVLGIVGTSVGMVWALNEKSRADTEAQRANESAAKEAEQRRIAEANEQKAIEEADRAERELARATEIKRLITEMLTSVDPAKAQGADTTLLKGLLDDAAARLAKGEITDELIAAELHGAIGGVYCSIGLYSQAEAHLPVALDQRERVLGAEHPDTLMAMNNLAILYSEQGRYAEAEPLHVETLEIRRRVLGAEHPATLLAMSNLATLYEAQGRYAEAEPLYLQTLEIQKRVVGEEHADTLGTMSNLAIVYEKQSRYAEAEPLYIETLEIRRRVLGEKHPDTLGTITNLGICYHLMGRYEDAALMFETSLPIKRRVLGMRHPWSSYAMQGLAMAYEALGRRDEALPLRRELLDLQTADADKPDANAWTLNDAAWKLLTYDIEELRDPARALAYARRACAAEEAVGGGRLRAYLDTLALAQHRTGDTAAAVETQRRAMGLTPPGQAERGEMASRLAEYEAAPAQATQPAGILTGDRP